MESEEIGRLSQQLPIAQVTLPARLVAGLVPDDIDALACLLAPTAETTAS